MSIINIKFLRNELEAAIHKIIDLKFKNINKEDEVFWKYILFVLEDALSKCDNNKYFSIAEIFDKVKDKNRLEELYYFDLGSLTDHIHLYFLNYLKEQLKYNEIFESQFYFNREAFLLRLIYHEDLYEEVVNYLLNNCKFDEEFVEKEGYTTKSLQEKYDFPVSVAFTCMIDILDDEQDIKTIIRKYAGNVV